jgi:Pectate lyase superfamily protein
VQRRDLSRILLTSAAVPLLTAKGATAQTGSAPYYPQSAAESSAGVTATNLNYQPGNVLRYGADPTGIADSTAAIQGALTVAQAVYFPAGNYTISAALTNGIAARRIYGDGPTLSVLRPTGPICALINTAPLSCVLLDNLGIRGDSSTLDAITQASGTTVFESRFENLDIWTGGRAFYLPEEFDTELVNCQGSSWGANVFELNGGNSTALRGCYAHQVPAGYYGYRIYASGHLDSCTGIDSPTGGDWGLFGATVSRGDSVNADFAVTLTNCDIEDFNNTGVRLRGTGFAKITGGSFDAKASGTYTAELYVEYCNGLVIIENTAFYRKGATRRSLAALYGENDFTVMMIGNCTPAQYDVAGVLQTLPIMATSYPSYLTRAININTLDVAELFCRYAGTAVLSGGVTTVSFGVPQPYAGYLVLVTGSACESYSVADKTVSGFTIASNNPSSTASVDWMVLRTGT